MNCIHAASKRTMRFCPQVWSRVVMPSSAGEALASELEQRGGGGIEEESA